MEGWEKSTVIDEVRELSSLTDKGVRGGCSTVFFTFDVFLLWRSSFQVAACITISLLVAVSSVGFVAVALALAYRA